MKKKRKMNPLFMLGIVTAVVIAIIVGNKIFSIDLFATLMGESKGAVTNFCNVNELESGKAYVWHHEGGDIKEDLSSACEKPVFFTCIKGDYNFKNQEMEEAIEHPRSIWVSSKEDDSIPTVTKDDLLIYVSSTEVPDGILFERFADYGYSIGISNMVADGGSHYYFEYAAVDEDDYKYCIDMNSDAAQLSELEAITKLYLDKVGNTKVREDNVSDGGSVLGLTKDKTYVCEFYTGTYYQDFKLTADIHSFSSMERFTSYEYEFMHSNFIVVSIPDYFKSGYYFVNGVGFFRYVTDKDVSNYNGKAFDENIEWNDPVIVYNENGEIIENPSDPDFVKHESELENTDPGLDVEVEGTTKKTGEKGEEEVDGS
ncbi:MAG: hypothetical protein PHX08_07765 [Lachnospiraceae bacterium]|nr:hypothetical protein [Lachnospiraceae bacterium]